jgi:aminopeptidase N
MRKVLQVAALALGATFAATSARAIDPFFPTFGTDAIDVIHYDIALDVALPSSKIAGKATLNIVALANLRSFQLDLAGLSVSEVRVGDASAKFTLANDKLTITPPKPIAKGGRAKVTVTYGGVPRPIQDPTAPDDPSLLLGWFNYKGAAYVVSEPVGASTFFPANDLVTDKASYSFEITVPKGFTAIANGVLVQTVPSGAKTRFVWRMEQQMTSWLATVHVNKFDELLLRTPNGKPLRFYTTRAAAPSDPAAYAKARDMLTYFQSLVGPYPFDGYGSVTVDDPALYYALETQAMSTFPTGAADEGIVAHELAHQWFGNSVAVGKWADLWLAEGFATYFEVLWPNRRSPKAFDDEMLAIYDYVVQQQLGPAVVDRPEDIFSDRTYLRGAMALYALKRQVGDEKFYAALTFFVAKYRGRNATSADFIQLASSITGDRKVAPLLNAWLYEEAVPELPGQPSGTARSARRGPAPAPDVLGLRCGRNAPRGAPKACGPAGAPADARASAAP